MSVVGKDKTRQEEQPQEKIYTIEGLSSKTIACYKYLNYATYIPGETPEYQLMPFYNGTIETRYPEGRPPGAVLLKLEEDLVLRHYVRDSEVMERISQSGLVNMKEYPIPYEERSPKMRNIYPDMRGLFLTDPNTNASQVGVPGSKHFVDIRVPKGTSVIHCNGNQQGAPIYLLIAEPNSQVSVDIVRSGGEDLVEN